MEYKKKKKLLDHTSNQRSKFRTKKLSWNKWLIKRNISAANNRNKKVINKKSASFTHYICEINNTQTDNAKYIDIIMQMYNLI